MELVIDRKVLKQLRGKQVKDKKTIMGQYWWCCQCGTCNEGAWCYNTSCTHNKCPNCTV